MRWREPVLIGVIAACAFAFVAYMDSDWASAVGLGIFAALAYVVHQGAYKNGG